LICVIFYFLTVSAPTVCAQADEAATVEHATTVLHEIMAIPANAIPAALLANAQGIAIVPGVIKGGFVVGVRRGKGIVLVRDDHGAWRPPQFVTLTGGSVGWQIGVQSTDVILVFRTTQGTQNLMNGKFTIGADAAAAAGPLGREATLATDAALKAEILSWSRSRGLFAGVSLDGSMLQIDSLAGINYYQGTGMTSNGTRIGETVQLPPSAVKLLETVTRYSGPPDAIDVGPSAVVIPSATEPDVSPDESRVIQQQLAAASRRLNALLDESWRRHLALPAEIYQGADQPRVEALSEALSHFEAVANNPQYQLLSERVEFQTTHELLRRYLSKLTSNSSRTLPLPAPPPRTEWAPSNATRY
jgi:lipid-binding SYLF domain-containing protein